MSDTVGLELRILLTSIPSKSKAKRPWFTNRERGLWTGSFSRAKVVIWGHLNCEAEERGLEREESVRQTRREVVGQAGGWLISPPSQPFSLAGLTLVETRNSKHLCPVFFEARRSHDILWANERCMEICFVETGRLGKAFAFGMEG